MAVEDLDFYHNNNDNNKNISLTEPTKDLQGFPESQLCVPQDSLEDIEWFPSFYDEIISFDGFPITPEHDSFFRPGPKTSEDERKDEDDKKQTFAFANKKRRSKRGRKREFWSIKQQIDSITISNDKFAQRNGDVRRKCSHCLTKNTPQWRMGPLGPKTLCNACGVRFKSGRLVPEYRPAASPTFDTFKHSNFHKKILQRRGLGG